MLEFMLDAGPLIYPLCLCSLLAVAITLERLWALGRHRVLPREIAEVVEAIQPGKDLSLAIEVCRRNPGAFSNVMRKGLELAGEPWEVLRDGVLDAGRQETGVLERHLGWLQTIAQVAPLLGLLGTVTGMLKVFAAIAVSGLGDYKAFTVGIKEALNTTVIGLAIGIPALVAYNLLTDRSERLIGEIEAYASGLVGRLRHRAPGGEAS